MGKTLWKDEYTLLCEKCGYIIDGLETSGNCPECGKPIAESLPYERPGSPWQRKASIWALIKTWHQVLRHPKRAFDEMRCIEQDGLLLALVSLLSATESICLLSVSLSLLVDAENTVYVFIMNLAIAFVYSIIAFIYGWITVFRITMMTRNKYRIGYDSSWTIVGHAAVGLCIPAFVIFLDMFLIFMIELFEQLAEIPNYSVYRYSMSIIQFLTLASFPVGIVVFEVLCIIGIRRCKFRNRIRPESDLSEPTKTDARTT